MAHTSEFPKHFHLCYLCHVFWLVPGSRAPSLPPHSCFMYLGHHTALVSYPSSALHARSQMHTCESTFLFLLLLLSGCLQLWCRHLLTHSLRAPALAGCPSSLFSGVLWTSSQCPHCLLAEGLVTDLLLSRLRGPWSTGKCPPGPGRCRTSHRAGRRVCTQEILGEQIPRGWCHCP